MRPSSYNIVILVSVFLTIKESSYVCNCYSFLSLRVIFRIIGRQRRFAWFSRNFRLAFRRHFCLLLETNSISLPPIFKELHEKNEYSYLPPFSPCLFVPSERMEYKDHYFSRIFNSIFYSSFKIYLISNLKKTWIKTMLTAKIINSQIYSYIQFFSVKLDIF